MLRKWLKLFIVSVQIPDTHRLIQTARYDLRAIRTE